MLVILHNIFHVHLINICYTYIELNSKSIFVMNKYMLIWQIFGFIINCMYYLLIFALIGADSFVNLSLISSIQPETKEKDDKASWGMHFYLYKLLTFVDILEYSL